MRPPLVSTTLERPSAGADIFRGVKVLEFAWQGVGPLGSRMLADFGATVVHVESSMRRCYSRVTLPHKDGVPDVNTSGIFPICNAGKYSISLNLNHPKAQDLAKQLVRWADIVTESFTPPIKVRWGLDYESLRKIREDIIYLSACQLGQTGPHADMPGFGTQLVGFAGFSHVTGWSDSEPNIPPGAHTDYIAFRFVALALVAALEYRRRTGKGQYIDMAQLEVSLQFLSPLLLDYMVNGREFERRGNSSEAAVPHGVYPCAGDDEWCAISVHTDEQWRNLRMVMGDPSWARDERFSTFLGRKAHEGELDPNIGAWTSRLAAPEVMDRLRHAGVPAGVVQRTKDLLEDPQLRHRGHYVRLRHSAIGEMAHDAAAFKLSRTPGKIRSPGPCLGEHTYQVCRKLLHMEDEEIAKLVEEGVLV